MVDHTYRIFTREFDEIVPIDALAEKHFGRPVEGAEDWRGVGDYFISHRPRPTWSEEDEASALRGLADAAAALGATGAALTILTDNSGSMRGHAIYALSEALYLAAPHLAAAGVRLEVLGYSTVAWKGGEVRKKWFDEGKPREPGRLNATRHIVFVDGDTPWEAGRENMLLAMRLEGLLKENFENEALRWAAERMTGRDGPHALLLVVDSDRPTDDATLAINDPDFLRRDLQDAVASIADQGIDFETVYLDMWTDGPHSRGIAPLYPKDRMQVVKKQQPDTIDLLKAVTQSLDAIASRLSMKAAPHP